MDYKKRFALLDQTRGFAIILMAIFHFSYDLTNFGFINIDFYKDPVWLIFPRIIVFLFLFCVGLSLPLSHLPKIKWNKFFVRFFKIVIAAIAISVFTYIAFPKQWVYFGTLHCIATCSLLALPFLNFPKISLLLGIALPVMAFLDINIPWINLGHKSMDYIPVFPWLGVVLIGIFAHSVRFHQLPIPNYIGNRQLQFLGRHSLIIYLIHQPLLFVIVYLIRIII